MSSRSWFSKALLAWYAGGHRDLPWRRTRDPYLIWLSEVVLQQTRVDQGLGYYERFVQRYPTVRHLAGAPDDEVMRLWQGLGYYGRARNLLATARAVAAHHGGTFPGTVEGLLALKGVGPYTAAAVASIAFGRAAAVVDGNVHRVLARVFGIAEPMGRAAGRKRFADLASSLLDPVRPGDHNQAVMELGATVCLPRRPACGRCPLAARCIARKEGRIAELPLKERRGAVRERHFNYLVIGDAVRTVLRRRTQRDIWRDLHEPPMVETGRPAVRRTVERLAGALLGRTVRVSPLGEPHRQVLSHQVVHARFWRVDGPAPERLPEGWALVDRQGADRLAVPRLIERHLQRLWAPCPAAAGQLSTMRGRR